jgi:hypothetical protein
MNTEPRVPATMVLRTVSLFGALLVNYGKITVLQNTQLFNQLNIICAVTYR